MADILWSFASRICSKQCSVSLCSSHLTFSLGISLKSNWYNLTVILTQLGKISISKTFPESYEFLHKKFVEVIRLTRFTAIASLVVEAANTNWHNILDNKRWYKTFYHLFIKHI